MRSRSLRSGERVGVRGVVLLALVSAACEPPPATQPTRRGELQVQLTGMPAPLTDAAHDFGPVSVGASKQVAIEAVNTGRDALKVTAATLETADTGAFYVLGGAGRLEPQQKVVLTLTFAPVRVGAQTARLVLQHDADAPTASVALTGTGQ